MWKRMQGKVGGAKQPDYSIRPQDPNSTISPVDLYQPQGWDSRAIHAAPQRPQRDPREQSEQSLPDIPFENAEIGTAQQGHRRQASSVYSQYPITPGVQQHQDQGLPTSRYPPQNQASANFHDKVRNYEENVEISPQSSPEMSPIHVPQLTGPTTSMSFMPSSPPLRLPVTQRKDSNIPVMRREKKQNEIGRKQVGRVRAVSASTKSSYDPYSQRAENRGLEENQWETVNSLQSFTENDRPATQWPGAGEPTPAVTNLEGMYGAPYAKQPTQSFGDRVRKIRDSAGGKHTPPLPTNQRPEWKGGSGRMAIVPAPEDNPYVAPLQIPRKSSKRVPSLPSMSSSRTQTPHAGTPIRESSPLSVMTAKPQGYFNGNKNLPPRTSSASASASPAIAKYDDKYDDKYEDRFAESMPASPLDSLPSQKNRSVSNLVPGAFPQSGASTQRNIPPSVSTIERNFDSALADVKIGSSPPNNTSNKNQHPAHQQHHPNEASRFSVTTYATSTNANSPRTSTDSAPPVPDMTQSRYHQSLYSQANPSEDSILNRRRPVAPSTHTFDATTAELERPALPRDTTLKVLAIREHKPSLSKALPKSPMELSQSDKCLALQAQLDDLALQRGNIERSITAMTKLIPSEMTGLPPGLDMEGRKREMERREREKKKVEGLKEELARVKSQEHEVGLKLHRALRKRDEGGYEPTGLWVRRVTG